MAADQDKDQGAADEARALRRETLTTDETGSGDAPMSTEERYRFAAPLAAQVLAALDDAPASVDAGRPPASDGDPALEAPGADAQSDETLAALLDDQHEADIADVLEQLRPADRRRLLDRIGDTLDPAVLTELTEGVRDDVLEHLPIRVLSKAIQALDSDDVVYLVENLRPKRRLKLLKALSAKRRTAVEEALAYPEASAGRLMQREIVWAPSFVTVGEMIDKMRAEKNLPEQFYEIVLVDPRFQPVGAVSLSRVMGARRHIALASLMEPEVRSFRVDAPQSDVAYAFKQYHLVSAPVVDAAGRLVGVITIDDAVEIIDEEAEEDLLRLGGVGDEEIGDTVASIVTRRFPWLAVNLLTAIAASLVIGLFDEAIAELVALAVLMPIVASMGGNAGTQTLTVAVRALATKDLTAANAFRIIGRETLVGVVNGCAFALLVGAVGFVWFGGVWLGAVLAVAMVITMLAAALAGILIPIGLERAGADPALASAVFVTTVTDIVGFFAFLGVAAVVLL